jgi:hypothetical protein
MTRVCLFNALSVALLGCAAGGTRPQDMSAAQHASAAQQEEQKAAQHGAEYDSAAQVGGVQCGPRADQIPGSWSPSGSGGACWTSLANPTDQHKADAQRHRDLAAQHRAASQALRDAEARACSGLSEADRDTSPFAHRDDIASVEILKRESAPYLGTRSPGLTAGASVTFRATPGMSAEWLQRLVDCHMARAAAAGFEMPEMSYCPLMLKNVRATVTPARGGFAVEIRSDDAETAKEIIKRSEALVAQAKGTGQ